MSGAERTRRWRARDEAGLRVLRFVVDREHTLDVLRSFGALPRAYAGAEPDWRDVEAAAAELWSSIIPAEIEKRVTRHSTVPKPVRK